VETKTTGMIIAFCACRVQRESECAMLGCQESCWGAPTAAAAAQHNAPVCCCSTQRARAPMHRSHYRYHHGRRCLSLIGEVCGKLLPLKGNSSSM
jgi:hypothetical protein